MTEKQEAYSKYISAMAELLLHEKYSVDEITEILKDDWEAAYENAGLQDHALDVGKAFTDMSIDQTAGDRAADIVDAALGAIKSLSGENLSKIDPVTAPSEAFMLMACIIELYGVRPVAHEMAWGLAYSMDRGLGQSLMEVFKKIANYDDKSNN